MVRTIIFDFDGTIADSFVPLIEVFEAITSRGEKLTQGEIKNLRGQPIKGILKYLKIKKWRIPSLLVKGRRAMGEKITSIKPFEEIPSVLKQLNDKDYEMIILSTNSSDNISKFLEANNLAPYFKSVHGGVGIFNKASALKNLMKKERLNSEECVYIGDEVRDIEAAKKVGINHISAAWGFSSLEALKNARPAAIALHPQELLLKLKTF